MVNDLSGISLGTKNPFRFKSYYYDEETQFYYLNSRYYDPFTGRFISADDASLLLGGEDNLFRYCDNNPTNKIDLFGFFAYELFDTIEDAARDFALLYNSISINRNLEYGSVIFSKKVNGRLKYYYSTPFPGTYNGVVFLFIPIPGQIATIHSHAKYESISGNEFSSKDKKYLPGKLAFVVTHNGSLQSYDKTNNQVTNNFMQLYCQ